MFEMIISTMGETQLNVMSEVVFYTHLAPERNRG